MADFVIVIAALAGLGGPAPVHDAPAAAATAAVPLGAPSVGFRTYPDAVSCEQAAAGQVAPAGKRFVCLPVEREGGDTAKAY